MTAKILHDMTNRDYHQHKAVSRSALLELKKSPKKYHYRYLSGEYEDTETDALKKGTAFHTMILEPENISETVAILPEHLKKPSISQRNAKNPSDSTIIQIREWDKWQEENAEKAHLKKDEVDELRAMANSLRNEPATRKLLGQKCFVEPSIFWTDPETGIDLKCRIDGLPEHMKMTLDVKTTADVDPESFSRSIVNYGYSLQAFMQQEAVYQLTGERPEATIFVCCEKKPPYDTGFFMADEMILKHGELWYRTLLRQLAECRLNDIWPSQGGGRVQAATLPSWEVNKMDKIGVE